MRFIPTRVGKLKHSSVKTFGITVHPHACGEINLRTCSRITLTTVHPHTCGEIDEAASLLVGLGRFIPTRVGKFNGAGEIAPAVDGSSPHVWGNLWVTRWWMVAVRFIPTRVGKF